MYLRSYSEDVKVTVLVVCMELTISNEIRYRTVVVPELLGFVVLFDRYYVSILEILSPTFKVSKPGTSLHEEHLAAQLLVRSLIRKSKMSCAF